MEKRKFDKELLDSCLVRDGATLILIKYLNDRNLINRDIIIEYKCKCNNIGSRTFRNGVELGL